MRDQPGKLSTRCRAAQLLKTASCGFGYLALADMCAERHAADARNPLAAKTPHFKPRAKRVIFLFMAGPVACRHVRLQTADCRPTMANRPAMARARAQADESPFKFSQHGQADCGSRISFRTWPGGPTIFAC